MKKSLALILLLMGTSVAYGEIYTWKDSRGTAHYTNSLNEIPSRYLKKARVLDVATGKTGGPAVAQPGTGAAAGTSAPPSSQPPMAPAVIVPPPAQPAPGGNGAPAQPAPANVQGGGSGAPAAVTAPQQVPPPGSFERRTGPRRHTGAGRVREE